MGENIVMRFSNTRLRGSSAGILNTKPKFLFVASAVLLSVFSGSFLYAQEDYSTWPQSALIYINTTSTGANTTNNVAGFPLLVRLNSVNFTGISGTLNGGADIRFAKSDGTHLSYQIERWVDNGSNDSAWIWVRLDTVYANNNSQFIRMFYGKSGVSSASNGNAVFATANGFAGVYHLGEGGTGTRNNSAQNNYNGTTVNYDNNESKRGIIGLADSLETNDGISLGNISITSAITLSAWVKVDSFVQWGKIISKQWSTLAAPWQSYALQFNDANPANVQMNLAIADSLLGSNTSTTLSKATWFYVTGTYNGSTITTYRNGMVDGAPVNAPGSISPTATNTTIGYNDTMTDQRLNGVIDEPRIETVCRSAAWVKLCYETQKATASCLSIQTAIPPAIAIQPRDTQVIVGRTAFFTVEATGPGLTYVWYKTAVAPANVISGATTKTLTFAAAQLTDDGSYQCVITNPYGSDTTKAARLIVNDGKPVITIQPVDTIVQETQPFSFAVTAVGESLTYAWYKNSTAGQPIAGQTTRIFSRPSALLSDTGTYICVVSNPYGSVPSRAAKLTVVPNRQVNNPIELTGTFVDNLHVRLAVSRYAGLPVTPPDIFFAWQADTVLVWYQANQFPSSTARPVPNLLSFPLAALNAAGGDRYEAVIPVNPGPAGLFSYYFKASVHWKNMSTTKDSVPPLSPNAAGTIVPMYDTSTLANPLQMQFTTDPLADSVIVTISGLTDPSMRWDLIDSLKLRYSVAGATAAEQAIPKSLIPSANAMAVVVKDPRFLGEEKLVFWDLRMTGIYGNKSGIVYDTCIVGVPRPTNSIVLRYGTVSWYSVQLLWGPLSPAVDSIRVWCGLSPVPSDSVPSGTFSSVVIGGADTAVTIMGLHELTMYYFGAQVFKNGMWSQIPAAAKTEVMTLKADQTAPIPNKLKIISVTFDTLTNKLNFTWQVDTSGLILYAGIVWLPDSAAFPEPSTVPPVGKIVTVTEMQKPMTVTLDVDGTKLQFDRDYYFGIWLQKEATKWSAPTDSSIIKFHVPQPAMILVNCFKDADTITVFGGAVALRRVEEMYISTKLRLLHLPVELSGLIPVSAALSLEQQYPPPVPMLVGLRYDSIPVGYTVNDIRMYHYDAANNLWLVDTCAPIPEESTHMVFIRILASANECKMPFLLGVDASTPVLTVQSDIASPVAAGNGISMSVQVQDNIANCIVTLYAGRGDDILSYRKTVVNDGASSLSDWVIPDYVVEGDCGLRAFFTVNDGRNTSTVDVSRDMLVSNSDFVAPPKEQWVPLGATAVLDAAEVATALDEFADAGKPWSYDIKTLRLFRWIGATWQEYGPASGDLFSFIPGRIIWLKTRKTDAFNFGTGHTVSLKQPYTVKLEPRDWTDFCLPYRFSIRIGDILAATDPTAAESLQFYVWEFDDVKGRYVTNGLYLPWNDELNNKKTELAYMKDGEKAAYSVFNPLNQVVDLNIPGTPVILSGIPKTAAKKSGTGWSLAVRSRTPESGELSPVFCAYVAGGTGYLAYPLPPSWSNVSVGICDAGRKQVFGNVIARELANGGYSYELVFENNQASATTVSYSIERLACGQAEVAVLDPQSGMAEPAGADLSVTVGPHSREYRWLAVGSPGYLESFGSRLVRGEFSLVRVTPNPLRGSLHIEYQIPYGGIEGVRCEMLDQLGRVVWSTGAGKNVHPGKNEIVWNPHGRKLASGAYIIRLTGFNGKGKVAGQKLARVMYLP